MADIIRELSRLSSIDSGRILMTEVYRHKFQRIFREDDNVENLPTEPDSLFAFVPSFSIQKKKKNQTNRRNEKPKNQNKHRYELATKNEYDPQFALVPIVLRKLGDNPTHCSHCGKGAYDGKTSIKRCAKCKEIGYCSQECQAADWQSHKQTCRPMYVPFGIPFLLSVPRKNTNYQQLSLAVWSSLRRYFNFQKEKNPSSSTLFARPTALFQLKYLEGAKRESRVEESELPLDFEYSVVIAADWEIKEVESFFGEALQDVSSLFMIVVIGTLN